MRKRRVRRRVGTWGCRSVRKRGEDMRKRREREKARNGCTDDESGVRVRVDEDEDRAT